MQLQESQASLCWYRRVAGVRRRAVTYVNHSSVKRDEYLRVMRSHWPFILVVLLLVLGCEPSDHSSPKPPKPTEQFLEIKYRGIGWSPNRNKWYFLKILQEKKDYKWGVVDSEDPHWIPQVTRQVELVCSVDKEGQNRRECFELKQSPNGIDQLPFSATVLTDDSIAMGIDQDAWLLTRKSSRLITARLGWVPHVEASPDGEKVCISHRESGLMIFTARTGNVRKLTEGVDVSPRWAPDSKQILFIRKRNSAAMDGELIVIEVESGKEGSLGKANFSMGIPSGAQLEWGRDSIIWLRPDYLRMFSSHASEFTIQPALEIFQLDTGSALEQFVVTESKTCLQWATPEARMGNQGYWAFDNHGYAQPGIRVVRFARGEPGVVGDFKVLYRADYRSRTIPNDKAWATELAALSDPDGKIW